jgi:hypothetical protein
VLLYLESSGTVVAPALPMGKRMTQVLWYCPRGIHNAVRGPTRPRQDNLCRYCVACSQDDEKLVKRSARAVEAKRAAKVKARRVKSRKRRAGKVKTQADVISVFSRAKRSVRELLRTGNVWPRSLRTVEVVPAKRPRRTRFKEHGIVIYDHGHDEIDARAYVYVAVARWWAERERRIARESATYTTHLRLWIEWVSSDTVRPRLDSLRDIEAEVSDLLRKQEAVRRMETG